MGVARNDVEPDAADRDDGSDDIFLDLNEEGLAGLADERWIAEQINSGAFVPYRGQWIAVVNKTLLGHGKSLRKLREDVTTATGISVNRIVTTYIEPPGR